MRKAGLLLFCLMMSLISFSQTRIHMKGGLTLASLKDEFDPQKQARAGFYAGLSGTVPLNSTIFLQPELIYSLRGYRFPATATNSSGVVAQNYLSLPILLGYSATPKWRFLIGPEPGYLVWANSRFDGDNHNVTKNINYRFNVDATGEMNYVILKSYKIETRFCFGVTPQYKAQLTDNLGNNIGYQKTGYHRVLEVGVKYELSK